MTQHPPPSGHEAPHVSTSDAAADDVGAALELLRRDAPAGMERLIPLVYTELRRIAHHQLASEVAGHTLSTTALVHEAYLRLAGQQRAGWVNREQFFALAARVMRRVLIDYARRHQAIRRGGGVQVSTASLDDTAAGEDADVMSAAARGDDLLALDEALDRFATVDARAARVVECRFFGGLSEVETASALGVSPRTVAGDWRMARGWLYRFLSDGGQ